ncbi:HAD-IA family hydrolase [Neisseria leonii]|uniref:HAD-IA family hydrolase n=1 Tax=Neisseria leonii TaxID=2995413 RepID=UPI00237BCC7E|nr:HAD-IA family hydrolase [Neisseria sp. 3986]MDD9324867.1 HAD-IA family hydrolase [Neisseria sp. 3986]
MYYTNTQFASDKRPQVIIFDWDGTLADTAGPIVAAMRAAFAENGLTPPPSETVRQLIGYSLPVMVARLAADCDSSVQARIMRSYMLGTLNPNNGGMRLFDDALPCLDALKTAGFRLAVATGKGRAGLDKAIVQTGTADYWETTCCADECPSKPAPDMVREICGELGVLPSCVWVVGDTVYDVQMALAAGAQAVAVTTGAHDEAQLRQANPSAVIGCLAELPALLAV